MSAWAVKEEFKHFYHEVLVMKQQWILTTRRPDTVV